MDVKEVLNSYFETIFKSILIGTRDWIKEKGAQSFEDLIQHYLKISLN